MIFSKPCSGLGILFRLDLIMIASQMLLLFIHFEAGCSTHAQQEERIVGKG